MAHVVIPVRTYLAVFLSLLTLTALTVYAAFQDMGVFNNVVALGIAVAKATLVVLYFMHMRQNTRLNKVVLTATFFFFFLLIGLLFSDTLTRNMLAVPGRNVGL